jgi:hypothetical protein
MEVRIDPNVGKVEDATDSRRQGWATPVLIFVINAFENTMSYFYATIGLSESA